MAFRTVGWIDAPPLRAGRGAAAARRLWELWRDHPRDAVVRAVAEAHRYGMFDADRLERMVLRRVAGTYFQLPLHGREAGDPGDPGDPGGGVKVPA